MVGGLEGGLQSPHSFKSLVDHGKSKQNHGQLGQTHALQKPDPVLWKGRLGRGADAEESCRAGGRAAGVWCYRRAFVHPSNIVCFVSADGKRVTPSSVLEGRVFYYKLVFVKE